MIPELAPAFVGPFAWWASRIADADDPRPRIKARDLIEGPILAAIVCNHQHKHPQAHSSAFAAMWARFYSAKVIPVTIAASLLLGRRLPMTLDDVDIILGPDDALPVAAVLTDAGEPDLSSSVFDRFETLVFGHLELVFDALVRHGRVGRKVLWGDAGLSFEHFLHATADMSERPFDRLCFDPLHLFAEPRWSDGRPNPLFEPTITVETPDGPRKQRKTCCLTYRFGGDATFCGDCPISAKQERRAACAKEAA